MKTTSVHLVTVLKVFMAVLMLSGIVTFSPDEPATASSLSWKLSVALDAQSNCAFLHVLPSASVVWQ